MEVEELSVPLTPPCTPTGAARLLRTLVVAASLALAPAAIAQDAALTLVRGPDTADTVEFSLEGLAELPQVTVVTENEFSDGPVSYRGPLMRDILAHLGLESVEVVRLTAVNDYYVDIPTSDFRRYDVILAIEADGVRLSRREKGPLWVMYPISDHSELRDPVYNTRLIWQVVRIEAL